jgi:dTDP-4-amino-4,6-dideoxygalactose transaminase
MAETLSQIPIARPVLGEPEIAAAARVIASGWLTQGREVAAFEQEFAEYVNAPHACAVSNCTTALHLALLAVGVRPGDEVITVSHSFIATASAVRYCGAIPVFVDIEPDTYNMDPDLLEEAMTPKTRAILVVHQLGMPADLARIVEFAHRRGLPLVEDAACASGSEILWHGRWERIGKPHGDIACFSFHPRKVMTTGDGGMLTTANPEYDRKFRLWRQHGMNVPDTVRHNSRDVIFESYPEVGYNYRLTDLQAAVGREQLKRLPHLVRRRREVSEGYQRMLCAIPGLRLPREPDWARSNWQSYCVGLPLGVEQREVMQRMLDEGISTRRAVMCIHREAAYADLVAVSARHPLPASEFVTDTSIILPLYDALDCDSQTAIVRQLKVAVSATGAPEPFCGK